MLSGNGRHRRPRQAPALVVAAGVTGSAIALPLLGAGSATAADSAVWDRVAECESGGAWSADTGNGYYGGLQMSQQTWEAYGGLEYASGPDLASRSQQITVAEKVLAAEGAKAWASCAGMAGLAVPGADAAPKKATGATEDAAPSGARSGGADADSGPSGKARAGDAAPSAAAGKDKGATDRNAEQGSPAPARTQGVGNGTDSAPAAGKGTPAPTGGGKHRGAPAEESAARAEKTAGTADRDGTAGQDAASAPAAGSTASEAATADTGAAPQDRATGTADRPSRAGEARTELTADTAATAADRATAAGAADTSPSSYTVQPGDSLSVIAAEKDVDGGWNSLYERNKDTVGADPDLIHPGQSLDLENAQQ
ncbi:transglycosylase family protein [Streptomyces clavuligerus]|uniref:Secreted protein n=1 Tax=Streptomyces clavuligerus TaxID=1901 RepID=E2Q6G6_STRCL|nr:hypothetical protein BB341_17285 [Streptomyces clavuligerus]AXU14462.1 LysM peptidoglycan-binding domain-containing protein [Streptomyces clavuligerus]EFG07290.1 secreted protein [Streptomyces clavuligerus]MBY6304475.1 transglycosylase family protein [Streptomyces clavuligerus]QCS07236.1 LysM peptidoglycan-binding domain-containing protein [Streptomyces clavuligerus]